MDTVHGSPKVAVSICLPGCQARIPWSQLCACSRAWLTRGNGSFTNVEGNQCLASSCSRERDIQYYMAPGMPGELYSQGSQVQQEFPSG